MATAEGKIRLYSGSAVETSLTSDITEASTSISVQDASSYPSPAAEQYVAVRLDEEGANEEVIYYGTKNGNVLQNCLRGQDGTVARTHKTGEKVQHVSTALDFREANKHVNETDPNYVPHANQSVHRSVSQTITAGHTVSGNTTVTGTTNFVGTVTANTLDTNTLTVDTIAGPVSVTGAITYATPAATPVKISGTTPAAGVSNTPMRSDAKIAVDARAMLRISRPAGEIMEWSAPTLPSEEGHDGEWAWADGSEISATTYPVYAAKVGNTWGTASSGKVRLPNKNGRVPVGADGAHTFGTSGGSTTKQLGIAELPNHTHTPNDPGHDHSVGGDYGNRWIVTAPNTGQKLPADNTASGLTTAIGDIAPNVTGITLQATGGSQAFNIEQPWIAVKYVVKVH